MDTIYHLVCILLFGLFFGYSMKYFKLPSVTGYLIAGIVIGPFLLGFIHKGDLENLEIFSTIALAFISFLIGSELKIKMLKRVGGKLFLIALATSLTTFAFVTLGTYLYTKSLSSSLLLGAIAASTAPSAILLIVKEYKARGSFTNHLLGIIAIDDIISIVIFGFVLVIAGGMNSGSSSLLHLLEPFRDIALSIVYGLITGLSLGLISTFLKSPTERMILAYLGIGIPILVCYNQNISPLLTCMLTGFIFVNTYKTKVTEPIIRNIDSISPPILLIFFVVSGASLDISLLPSIGWVGILYIVCRMVGKSIGSRMGCTLTHTKNPMKKYLGITLLSQTGIAIGLASTSMLVLPLEGDMIMTVVIASSFLFDIVSPFIVKMVLKKVGDSKL